VYPKMARPPILSVALPSDTGRVLSIQSHTVQVQPAALPLPACPNPIHLLAGFLLAPPDDRGARTPGLCACLWLCAFAHGCGLLDSHMICVLHSAAKQWFCGLYHVD
jgi:hypothetical protein